MLHYDALELPLCRGHGIEFDFDIKIAVPNRLHQVDRVVGCAKLRVVIGAARH